MPFNSKELDTNHPVRVVTTHPPSRSSESNRLGQRVSVLEGNRDLVLQHLESLQTTVQGLCISLSQIDVLQTSVQGIQASLQEISTTMRARSSSPGRMRSPARDNHCYGCGKQGHFRRIGPRVVRRVNRFRSYTTRNTSWDRRNRPDPDPHNSGHKRRLSVNL